MSEMSDHLFLCVIRSLDHIRSGDLTHICKSVLGCQLNCITKEHATKLEYSMYNADNDILLTRVIFLLLPMMITQWRVLFALVIEGNYSTKQSRRQTVSTADVRDMLSDRNH